jgi:hypothetical protein
MARRTSRPPGWSVSQALGLHNLPLRVWLTVGTTRFGVSKSVQARTSRTFLTTPARTGLPRDAIARRCSGTSSRARATARPRRLGPARVRAGPGRGSRTCGSCRWPVTAAGTPETPRTARRKAAWRRRERDVARAVVDVAEVRPCDSMARSQWSAAWIGQTPGMVATAWVEPPVVTHASQAASRSCACIRITCLAKLLAAQETAAREA